MEPWAEHFVSLWTKNRVVIAETILQAVKNNPNVTLKEYTVDDMVQMFDGMLAMMAERLSGSGTEIWDNYMDTIILGILSQGQPLSALVGQATMNGMVIHQLLVPLAQKKYREKVSTFLIEWYTFMNTEIVKMAVRSGMVN